MIVLRSSVGIALMTALAGLSLLISVHAIAEDQTPFRPSWYARGRISDLTLEDAAYRNSDKYQSLRRRYEGKLADARAHPERAGAIASELWEEVRDYPGFSDTPEGQEDAKLGLLIYAEIVAIWESQHPDQNTRDGTRFIRTNTTTQDELLAPFKNTLPNRPASSTGDPQNYQSTITGGDLPADPYASGAVLQIVRDAKTGAVVDVSRLRPESSAAVGNTRADTTARVSKQWASTITSRYDPITETMAREIVARYGSVPGGLLLEGESAELASVRNVRYLAKANVFILNDSIIYPNPVQQNEFTEISRAISQDDRLGISLGFPEKRMVFGKLPADGRIAMNLFVADGFLGDIVYGYKRFTSGYVHAPGYDSSKKPETISFYLKVLGYRFARNDAGVIVRVDTNIQTTLVPITSALAANGGPLPDFDRIRTGEIFGSNLDRLRHLNENFAYYARERILRLVLGYGEAAAFVRALKNKGIRVAGL